MSALEVVLMLFLYGTMMWLVGYFAGKDIQRSRMLNSQCEPDCPLNRAARYSVPPRVFMPPRSGWVPPKPPPPPPPPPRRMDH